MVTSSPIHRIFASSIPVWVLLYIQNRFQLTCWSRSDLHVNCEALMIFITAFGEFARGFASINFALRTWGPWFHSSDFWHWRTYCRIAVWSHNRYIIVLMCLLVLGQWAMIIRSKEKSERRDNHLRCILDVCIEKAMWTPTYGCVTTSDNASWLTALFAYWVFFDTIVVFLNAYKHGLPTRSLGTQNSIKNILFNQGLSYYLVAWAKWVLFLNGRMLTSWGFSFSADFIAIVCLATKVNMLTVSICTVAAETLSTVCRENVLFGFTEGTI